MTLTRSLKTFVLLVSSIAVLGAASQASANPVDNFNSYIETKAKQSDAKHRAKIKAEKAQAIARSRAHARAVLALKIELALKQKRR